jgi:hypothetical protein
VLGALAAHEALGQTRERGRSRIAFSPYNITLKGRS